MENLFAGAYDGRTVLVTGHTGFKGSWLTCWLLELGANVVGYSLEQAPTDPSNFVISDLAQQITDVDRHEQTPQSDSPRHPSSPNGATPGASVLR